MAKIAPPQVTFAQFSHFAMAKKSSRHIAATKKYFPNRIQCCFCSLEYASVGDIYLSAPAMRSESAPPIASNSFSGFIWFSILNDKIDLAHGYPRGLFTYIDRKYNRLLHFFELPAVERAHMLTVSSGIKQSLAV